MVRTRLSSLLQLLFACSCCGTSSSSAGPRPPWGGPVAGVWPWAVDQQLLTQGSVSLRVAAIQLTDFADGVDRTAAEETAARVAKAVGLLAQAAALGVDVALFPEMSLVQYNGAALLEGTQDSMEAAWAPPAIWGSSSNPQLQCARAQGFPNLGLQLACMMQKTICP